MKQKLAFKVVLEYDPDDPSEYKWSVYCPTLPACFSEGRTREEALANIREVIEAYLDIVESNLASAGLDIEVVEVER